MDLHTWLLFLATAMGISLSPGPNCLLVLTRASQHGVRPALATIFGGLLGFTIIIAMCTYGLGALLQASVQWMMALKIAGGLYLAWLGYKLWRSPAITLNLRDHDGPAPQGLFRQGFVCGVTNPKSYLFFTALLPHFLDPSRSLFVQFLILATTYACTEFAVEFALAVGAVRIRPWLARTGKHFNQTCGGLFIAIGGALPLRA